MSRPAVALVGDYSGRHAAHRAIPKALELARDRLGADVRWEWVGTRQIGEPARDLAAYSGVWLVPASPYESAAGAIGAVRWAREGSRPFLGTCGGFQHALLEYALNVAGIAGADHAETNPRGNALVVTELACSLVEKMDVVFFAEGSLLRSAYGRASATEGYRCSYGLNPAYRPALEASGLRFSAWDNTGEVRGAELPGHPFFAGMLFQPERAALRGEVPPAALAFMRAVVSAA
jgi:CTP synthase (UTP-ammonia lyase)